MEKEFRDTKHRADQTLPTFTRGQKLYVAGESVRVIECYFSAMLDGCIGLRNRAADCGDPFQLHDVLAVPNHVFLDKIDAYRAHAAILRKEAEMLEDIAQMSDARAATTTP